MKQSNRWESEHNFFLTFYNSIDEAPKRFADLSNSIGCSWSDRLICKKIRLFILVSQINQALNKVRKIHIYCNTYFIFI